MMHEVSKLYKKLLNDYPDGISSTSTKKFDDIKRLFCDKYSLNDSQIYAVGAGTRPGNLEVRFCQGEQAQKMEPTELGLGFIKVKSNDEIKKQTESAFVTLEKMVKRGKSSYNNILVFVVVDDGNLNDVFCGGLIYSQGSSLATKLKADFGIQLYKLVSTDSDNSNDAELPIATNNKDLINWVSEDLTNTIFYGPPGTGKTHKMTEFISALPDDNPVFTTTFHQSFTYEDFVEGIKPVLGTANAGGIEYEIEKGIFYKACEAAAQFAGYDSLDACIKDDYVSRQTKLNLAVEKGKTVLIAIDEINRGNVSAIFGDLISLIENSKRLGAVNELSVTLPYSKKVFGVPLNLKIIATMNTADRSIQLMDSALRRRFNFVELLPNYDLIDNSDAAKILKNINAKLRCLIGKDVQIGHSYFMYADTHAKILHSLMNKVIPLLEEYFYNDLDKIRFVLNETKKTQYAFYKEDTEANKAYNSYIALLDIDVEDKCFYALDESLNYLIKEEDCKLYLDHLLENIFE